MRVKTCGLIIFLFACAASSVIIATGCPVAHLVASSVSKDVQGSSTATAFTAAFSQSAPARCYRSYLRFPASFDPHTPRFAPISTLQHKNHTGNNYMSRCHRNGIKRVPNFRFKSLKGVRCAPPPHTHTNALLPCLALGCSGRAARRQPGRWPVPEEGSRSSVLAHLPATYAAGLPAWIFLTA